MCNCYIIPNKLVYDFNTIIGSISGNCNDIWIKNSQGITVDEKYINFDDEVKIPVSSLSTESKILISEIYDAEKQKCLSDKVSKELKLIK